MTIKNTIIILLLLLNILAFPQEQKKLKIGLALSGGGAKGIAHIGVLKVLEEAGIRFDYITGTSMGSIVGGLYAIGYNADSVSQITKSIDWDYIINDKIERKDLSIIEKQSYEKYILSLPIRERKIYLPQGMHEGQNISLLLSDLTRPVHDITDFNRFEIPFACIVANIETGKSEVLNSGFLAEAMRASMAIPSVFTPVEINNRLYVDGGLLNNFPVVEVKEMGADIVIGIDVQSPYYKKEEITSPLKVLGQASKFLRAEANQKSRALCDILIKPEVTQFAVMGFDKYEEILKRGEDAGQRALPQILALLDSLNIPLDIESKTNLENSKDSVRIDTIIVKGINPKKLNSFIKKFKIKKGELISYNLIRHDINRAYGTQNFDRVVYKIIPIEGKNTLLIDVKEKNVRDLKVGVHYDPDLKTGLLLNYTSNNLIFNGLKLQIDGVISENPRAGIKLLFNGNGKISPELDIRMLHIATKYYEQSEALLTYSNAYYGGSFYLNSNIYNNLRIGGGIEWVHTNFSTNASLIEIEDLYNNYINFTGRLEFDSWNKTYYPTRGMVFKANLRVINEEVSDPAIALNARYEPLIQIHPRFSIQPKFMAGSLWENINPLWYKYKIGGPFPWYNSSFVPFIGYHFTQVMNDAYAIARIDLQYEFVKNHYLTAKANILKDDSNFEFLVNFNNYIPKYGYGLTYGYNSLIGPIELSASYNDQLDFFLYFNLGFWF